MKFAQHLDAHLTPEWRKQYIAYEELKKLIYDIESGLLLETDPEARDFYLNSHINEFLDRCREELVRVELFFFEKLKEAERRLNNLQQEVARANKLAGGDAPYIQDGNLRTDVRAVIRRSTTYLAAKQISSRLKDLKLAFTEFYLNLVLVQQFQSLNREGFRKILKKFDKVLKTSKGLEWRAANVVQAPFANDTKINDLIEKTEEIFINLEGGDRSKAMNRLRVLPITEQQSPWTTFFLGLYLGMFAILTLVIIWSKAYRILPGDPPWVWVRLFRGFLIFYLNIFLIGCNMYVWQRQGVNHVLIFEIDPRNHLTYQQLMEVAAFFLVFLAVCALAYLYADYFGVPRLIFPLFFLIMNLLWLLNPFNFWYRSSRSWLLRKTGHLLTPVFYLLYLFISIYLFSSN